MILDLMSYICYLVKFCKKKKTIRIILDFGSKINILTLAYANQLDLQIWKTNVSA